MEFRAIAQLDLAMARAWVELFDAASAWEPLFAERAEAVSRGAKDAVEDASAESASSLDPASLRLISSALGISGHQHAQFNALAAIHDGQVQTVYASPAGSIAGFMPTASPDGVLIVHAVGRGYEGAIVPRVFNRVQMTWLSLPDLRASELTLSCNEILDSIAISLPPAQGASQAMRLHVRTRHSWSNAFAVLECALAKGPCKILRTLPLHGTDAALEVTASTAYRAEPGSAGVSLPGDVLPRSVHASPDGKWLSYVRQQRIKTQTDPDWSHTLWVSSADGSSPREIAKGWGWLHSRWDTDGTLSFDVDPRPSESMARRLEANPETTNDWTPTPHQQQRLDLMKAAFELGRSESPWGAVEYAIGHYDPVEKKSWVERTQHPTRLWASFATPIIVGSSAHYVEVPFDPEDEPVRFDPGCTVSRG